ASPFSSFLCGRCSKIKYEPFKSYYETFIGYGASTAGGFAEGPGGRPGRPGQMGRHYAARSQRVDLLDDFRSAGGNQKAAREARVQRTQRGDATAVLLAGLYAPKG